MADRYSWMNGELVPWESSALHIGTEAVLRGASVFEGIRAYRSADDLLLFRVGDHLDRLLNGSARFLRMPLPYGAEELTSAICELSRANNLQSDVHIRVVLYFDELRLGREFEAGAGAYVLADPLTSIQNGPMRVTLSAWRRLSDLAMPPRVKANSNYVNSRIAIVDAQTKGFHSSIMLNEHGKVAEGPSMNVFMVRRGALSTPRGTDGILEGITRDTVIHIARQLGIPVEEREIDATELYVADELFFCGTAYEITPIVGIDGLKIGDGGPGDLTRQIQTAYFDVAHGVAPSPPGWITSVNAELAASSSAAASTP